jgi:hypothetical protein
MTKKDYQRIARAIYEAHLDSSAYSNRTDEICAHAAGVKAARVRIERILAADNPRFHRETFTKACETGDVGKRPPRRIEVNLGRFSAGPSQEEMEMEPETED